MPPRHLGDLVRSGVAPEEQFGALKSYLRAWSRWSYTMLSAGRPSAVLCPRLLDELQRERKLST
jgi:hypothetical protein